MKISEIIICSLIAMATFYSGSLGARFALNYICMEFFATGISHAHRTRPDPKKTDFFGGFQFALHRNFLLFLAGRLQSLDQEYEIGNSLLWPILPGIPRHHCSSKVSGVGPGEKVHACNEWSMRIVFTHNCEACGFFVSTNELCAKKIYL